MSRIHVAFGAMPSPKDPGATILVGLDFFNWLANFWEPGREYQLGDYVRPSAANGHAYECTEAGQSGSREPAWSGAGTTSDGKVVVWTARDAGANGLKAVASAPVVSVSPSGELAASGEAVVRNTVVQLSLSGGDRGNTYRVEVQVTAGVQTLVGSLLVPVADR